MKIAVLMGGTSAERDVSLATGREIARALKANGHQVVSVDTAGGHLLGPAETTGELAGSIGRAPPEHGELIEFGAAPLVRTLDEVPEVRDTDVVFVALHGGAGEDGRLQGLLDLIGIPYTGSGYLGSALAMDKLVSKELFVHAGIRTPAWLAGHVEALQVESALGGFPVVVKPSREGSTVGVSVVRSPGELESALNQAAAFVGPPIIEKFVPGRELAVGIVGDEALPVVEIKPSHEIYDYECKYTRGMSQYEVPAQLSGECTEEVQAVALEVHRVLRLSAYSRIDFRLDEAGKPWCLEANSLPGMTATSLLPKAAAAAGIPFDELCDLIVNLALQGRSPAGTRPGHPG